MAERSEFRLNIEKALDSVGITELIRNQRQVFTHHNKRSCRIKFCGYTLNSIEREEVLEAVRKLYPLQFVDVYNSGRQRYANDYWFGMSIRVFRPGVKGFKVKDRGTLPARRVKKKSRITNSVRKTCSCCGQTING